MGTACAAILRKYKRQENRNEHSENALLLAQTFGTEAERIRAADLIAKRDAQGFATFEHSEFQQEMSRKYYARLVDLAKPEKL